MDYPDVNNKPNSNANSSPDQLRPELLPLTGCHLIEASAGTGKTFNITRIYLRLLLERKLDVKNILVMTFTRAATEELRGRIAQEIRNALDNWDNLDPNDAFFNDLSKKFSYRDIYPALHNALLHLDEAAIFTIHGFCNRVLSQQAFSSGVAFNVEMEADTTEIESEAVRDWYRGLAQDRNSYLFITQLWPTPDEFHRAFRSLFSTATTVEIHSPETIQENYFVKKSDCLVHLREHRDTIFSTMVDSHKKKDERSEEWQILNNWLSIKNNDAMPKTASGFFDGRRYPKTHKVALSEIFTAAKQIKKNADTVDADISKARSYQLASEGIQAIRKKITEAKRNSRLMNYDDLIQQLAESLSSPTDLAALIRKQFPVALVDEFQDTDPEQYAILNAIFQNNKSTQNNPNDETALFMIGDPKQAIYAFRSGDVFTYLRARNDADYLWMMDTNWRSSSQMINAYNRLFYGAPLQDPSNDVFGFDIHYSPVNSAGKADNKPLQGSYIAKDSALQFVYFPYNDEYGKKDKMNQDFCPIIAEWCSLEIHNLLNSETNIGDDKLQEQDIAILVRDKREASHIQGALRNAGYPSVYLSTHDNVFVSEEATELEIALYGILELENDRALIAALSTRFMGCNTEQLFSLQEDETKWENYRETIFDLRETWLRRGFMDMALKLLHQNFIPNPIHHERSLTNAIQLLELLQHASQRHNQPEQLLHWFREQLKAESLSSESELRLESDANLIRIMTQHGCKGLEYPVVFIPFSTRYKDPAKFANKNIDIYKYHERDTRELKVFLGQDKTISDLYKEEAWAESIRLLYVAITRAEHRCYICATPFSNYHSSPLGQTLKLSAKDDLHETLEALVKNENSMHLRVLEETTFSVNHAEMIDETPKLAAAEFKGRIERNWWLSSFSALTRNLRQGGVSTPDRDQDELTGQADFDIELSNEIRFTLTKGAATGNLVHDILEHADFTQPHWQRCIERPLARYTETLESTQKETLIEWLQSCLETPLTGTDEQDSLKLSELTWANTLRETEFYFPMEHVKPRALSQLLSNYRNPNEDLNSTTIQLPGNNALQGMMHGFIDLVFHWEGKYYLADYKSNFLGNQFQHYNTDALSKNIRDNFYDLQYLLYSLALHRYLRLHISDYQPEIHFGGVFYLYLRGMSPDSNHGVYYTPIHTTLLDELDTLFSSETDTASKSESAGEIDGATEGAIEGANNV